MGAKQTWTVDLIKAGFDRFIAEHGRLPTALEVDRATDLPSSRQLQRSFGGLPKIRELLGYVDRHFGKGAFRSSIAQRVNKRGRDQELHLRDWLVEKFGEVFVHVEHPLGRDEEYTTKQRLDFLVYSPTETFGVDVFATDNRHTLIANLNSKFRKYRGFPYKLFLVAVALDLDSQDKLDTLVDARTLRLPSSFSLVTQSEFRKQLTSYATFSDPRESRLRIKHEWKESSDPEFGWGEGVKILPKISAEKILEWCDKYYAFKGTWPMKTSVLVPDEPNESWGKIDAALRAGSRGLAGKSSLSNLLLEHRGVKKRRYESY